MKKLFPSYSRYPLNTERTDLLRYFLSLAFLVRSAHFIMWALGFFLGMLLSNGIAADMSARQDLEECIHQVDLLKLEEGDLQLICPMMSNVFECLESVLVENFGLSLAELSLTNPREELKRGVDLLVNVRSLLSDLCTEGSDLNEAYRANAECFGIIGREETGCGLAAYDAYKELEETDQDVNEDNRMCMVQAYKFACLGARVHDYCGQSAFELFQTLIKRSTAFSNAFCPQGQLEEVKTKFLDSLYLEEPQRANYELAFDLGRRRKRSVAQ